MTSEQFSSVFAQSIRDYHLLDSVETPIFNEYEASSLEHLLYLKNWIDTVQWHLEDIIRNPYIDPVEGLKIKRRIDASNQRRTEVVEIIDEWFLQKFAGVQPLTDATINTESPAWAIDRLSILELKIYHMQLEAVRPNASADHRSSCCEKLKVLQMQHTDLSAAIDQLLLDIASGYKYMKVYRQRKMYNDASLNPVLYQQKKGSL